MSSGHEDPLRASARARGEAPAVETPASVRSYRRLDAAADRVARRVSERLGPRFGDRASAAGAGQTSLLADDAETGSPDGPVVAALLPRDERAVAALHGVPRAGAALAPLHGGWTETELSDYLDRLRPDALLCVKATEDRAAAVLPASATSIRLSSADELFGAPGREPPDASSPPDARPRAAHTVIATSGTSGRPRPVRLTLANHVACARGAIERLGLGPDDRWLASLSLAHVGGVAMVVRAAVVGCALVLREAFDAEELLRLGEAGRVTHASLVPVMLRRVLAAREAGSPAPDGPASGDARSTGLRCLLVGGDGADPGLVRRAHGAGFPVALTYGLTEAASQVATAPPERARRKPESVGRPLRDVEVRISEEGEILVRGPTVAPGTGVAAEPPAAADPTVAAAPEGRADGWLRTGDAGRLDEDGDLRVTGRLSDRIVTGGVTVDPAEVERVLRSHPAVREAAVVGLPDEEWGERVAAAIVLEDPVDTEEATLPRDPDDAGEGPSRALEDALDAHCRDRLAGPKVPRRRTYVRRLPRNANGKIDREGVRALLASPEAPDSD